MNTDTTTSPFSQQLYISEYSMCLFKQIISKFKGALDNILQFSFWLNFIYHVKIDC